MYSYLKLFYLSYVLFPVLLFCTSNALSLHYNYVHICFIFYFIILYYIFVYSHKSTKRVYPWKYSASYTQKNITGKFEFFFFLFPHFLQFLQNDFFLIFCFHCAFVVWRIVCCCWNFQTLMKKKCKKEKEKEEKKKK